MNLVQITLAAIATSVAVAGGLSFAEKQAASINAQQEQVRCLQESLDDLGNLNSVHDLARQENSLQSYGFKCKLQAEG